MKRKVFLQGELGEKFGRSFTVQTDNYRDIMRCINANRPEFLPFLINCHEEDIAFEITTAGKEVDEEEMLLPIQQGDVTIAMIPAGAKSGFAKIVAAAFMIFYILPTLGAAAVFSSQGMIAASQLTLSQAIVAGATASIPGMIIAQVALNLAITGIQQMMAPDPATDQDEPTNYLFSGEANNAKEGDPIPLLYGELRVPGRPISINMINGGRPGNNNVVMAGSGDMNQIGGGHTQHH